MVVLIAVCKKGKLSTMANKMLEIPAVIKHGSNVWHKLLGVFVLLDILCNACGLFACGV